jgi:hypothetical protein
MERARVDVATCVAWAMAAITMAVLSTVRTQSDLDPKSAVRAFPRRGLPLLISGIAFYACIFAAEVLRTLAVSRLCPKDSVCDMPAMGFFAIMSVVWLPGWLIFLPFVASAVDRSGIKPWRHPEARIAAVLVGLLLICWGALASRIGGVAIAAGLFYLCFGGWLLLVQYLCGRAAKTVRLEIQPGGP